MAGGSAFAYIKAMARLIHFGVRNLAYLIAAASALALASAYTAQYVFGLQPCALCVWQRWPYWAAAGLGLAAALTIRRPLGLALVGLAGGLIFAAGAGLAGFHLGVEQGWWPGLSTCTGVGGTPDSVEALRQQLLNTPVVRCDEVAFSLFGVSIAGFNLIASLALAALAFGAAGWHLRHRAAS